MTNRCSANSIDVTARFVDLWLVGVPRSLADSSVLVMDSIQPIKIQGLDIRHCESKAAIVVTVVVTVCISKKELSRDP